MTESLADWYPEQDLQLVLDKQEPLFLENYNKCGVYIITETWLEKTPTPGLWNHCDQIRYIGMSRNLSQRLTNYASGEKGNPVNRVADEHLANCSAHERRTYFKLTPVERQAWHKAWMEQRYFSVQVAHTEDATEAFRLECLLIRLHELHDDEPLWNKVRYTTTPPFRPAKKGAVA